MLTGIHFLLTYTCLFECDHCFLFCGPHMKGTFTLEKIEKVLDEAEKPVFTASGGIETGRIVCIDLNLPWSCLR